MQNAHFAALNAKHSTLDQRISVESQRPLPDQLLIAELKKRNVVLLRGDWTNRDPKITAELTRWNRSAVPFNLIYAPGKSEPVILPELLTPGKVLEAFAQAAGK